ncbi:MAG TPA: ATP-binding protein [Stellaceae bacterium]|nr:ATP-binding protein [Stellaceae bacterium]
MVRYHGWRAFLGSRAGANFWRLLCFSVVLAIGVGYGFYQYSLSAFTTSKGEETITALQLTDAFVNTYSAERARLGAAEAAVPATFRAHSIELFNKVRQGGDVLRLVLVGRAGLEIKTAPLDEQMAETAEAFAREPGVKSVSGFVKVGGHLVFRTLYPSIASQQPCVDCHNKQLAPGQAAWRLNDVMGVFSVDIPATAFLHNSLLWSIGFGLVVFLAVAGVGLLITILHFKQISEREVSQIRLQESEKRFRDFAETASDWFWEQDADLRFVYLSDPVTDSGLTPSAHIGKTRRDVVFHGVTPEQWRAHDANLAARHPFEDFRFQRKTEDGEFRHISVSGKPFFDEAGQFRGYRGTAKDVTAEISTELELSRRVDERTTELRHAQEELLRSERLSVLGQLTATVAHELRNPLSAIRNSVYAIRELISGKGFPLDRPLTRIERSIGRCDGIVTDLLDYARSRQLQCAPQAVDQWLGEVLDEQKLPEHVNLTRELAAPGVVAAFDPDRFRRVVVNLVENAAQSMAESEREKRPLAVTVATRKIGDSVEITVHDNGAGIAPDVLPRIFEPLFSTKSFGTGLGLPTVKQIVEQHGGQIELQSEVGVGTLAVVRLPLLQSREIAA